MKSERPLNTNICAIIIELADKVPNEELDHLTRLLSSGCPVIWGNESNTCETYVDVGITNHVEATGEDTDINDLGPIPMSFPPRNSLISNQEHAHMSSSSESFHLEERLVKTPVWLTKLKAHLNQNCLLWNPSLEKMF